jgi:uncharacterized protein DUF5666
MQFSTSSMSRGQRIAARCVLALCIAGTTIAGIQGTGRVQIAAFGVISATGDVTVNGTTYASDQAHVSMNGQPADASGLRIGQVVAIDGSLDPASGAAVAESISYVADVRGPVSSLDSDTGTFNVLNRSVRANADTVFDGVSLAGLTDGTQVEVSGYANSAGEVVATRVAATDVDADAQLRGVVSNLDPRARTFQIDTMLVDYATAAVTGPLAEGKSAFVRGDADGGTLVAGRIDVLAPMGAAGQRGDLEGIVTSVASSADFWIGGVHVIGDESTQYKLTPTQDAAIHVSGRFESSGVLRADKVDAKPQQTAKSAHADPKQ